MREINSKLVKADRENKKACKDVKMCHLMMVSKQSSFDKHSSVVNQSVYQRQQEEGGRGGGVYYQAVTGQIPASTQKRASSNPRKGLEDRRAAVEWIDDNAIYMDMSILIQIITI